MGISCLGSVWINNLIKVLLNKYLLDKYVFIIKGENRVKLFLYKLEVVIISYPEELIEISSKQWTYHKLFSQPLLNA